MAKAMHRRRKRKLDLNREISVKVEFDFLLA
jgi:hypothetical protein